MPGASPHLTRRRYLSQTWRSSHDDLRRPEPGDGPQQTNQAAHVYRLAPIGRPQHIDRRPGEAIGVTGQEHANARLAAALWYAQADWPVFPCIPGEKVPATKHGFLDATTDPDKITWWWARNPERNVAIATGLPGPDVLDVDVREDGTGFAALNRLHRDGLLGGASAYVRTPSGGLHAYFAGSQQGNGRLPHHHLDFRSKGGYVVAPPSQVNGAPYELVKQADGQGGLDWAAVTRLLEPERRQRLQRPEQRG
jgi:hypothetical protein